MNKVKKRKPPKTKYKVVSDMLFDKIKSGVWQPGDRLPSEGKLVADLDYSLGTVQRALRDLVELGAVERIHGSGTFVSGARTPEEHLFHFRFLSDDGVTLLPIFFRTKSLDQTEKKGPWADFLGQDNAGYVKIERVISVNREFEIFSELYLPVTMFPTLSGAQATDLDGVSIRDMLAERFNTPTLKAEQSIACSVFPPRVGQVINMPIGQFGIILTVCSNTYRDVPIIWQRAFIPPSDRQMLITANPRPDELLARVKAAK